MYTINTYYENFDHLQTFKNDNFESLFPRKEDSVFIQIFCGVCDEGYLSEVVESVYTLFPHAHIIGATTSGEIMNGSVSETKTVLSFTVFEHCHVNSAISVKDGQNDFDLGVSIATELSKNTPRLLILFSTGLTVDTAQVLNGIKSVNPTLPIAGGIAGDNFINEKSFVCCGKRVTNSGIVGAVLEGERLIFNPYSHLCWLPIGKEMEVTKAVGSRIYMIDHIPAYQIFKNYLGVDNTTQIIINSIFPLFVKNNDIESVCTPLAVYEDDSILVSKKLSDGDKVRFSYGQIDMIIETIESLTKKIREQPAESIFIYSCATRRGFLQDAIEIETLPLERIAPTVGFYTNGELFNANGANRLLFSTMTTLVLSENENIVTADRPCAHISAEDSAMIMGTAASVDPPASLLTEFASIKDYVNSRSIVILKALTNLVDKVTYELSERTAALEKINQEIQYSNIHDPLTDLFNRVYFEQSLKELEDCNDLAYIIICDLDGLKLINDTLGHSAGDETLKAAANVLNSIFSPGNVVARIGGDEFSVLVSKCSEIDAQKAIQLIQEDIAQYNRLNPSTHLSLSIGVSGQDNAHKDVKILFKDADNSMYRDKLRRSYSVRSNMVKSLIKTLEERDILIENHNNRLQGLVTAHAEYMGIAKNNLHDMLLFARYHDIGKIGIPDSILFKSEPLTHEEREEIQRHCEIGYRIAMSSAELIHFADWILKHHEWWNGEGYPIKLKGEDIPIQCRIMAIFEAYDTMTNDQPYRKAILAEDAIGELRRNSGTQFDPNLVEKFIAHLT